MHEQLKQEPPENLVSVLTAQNARLREALENIEWAAVRSVGGMTISACPCCYRGHPGALESLTRPATSEYSKFQPVREEYAREKLGHSPDCKLSAALSDPPAGAPLARWSVLAELSEAVADYTRPRATRKGRVPGGERTEKLFDTLRKAQAELERTKGGAAL